MYFYVCIKGNPFSVCPLPYGFLNFVDGLLGALIGKVLKNRFIIEQVHTQSWKKPNGSTNPRFYYTDEDAEAAKSHCSIIPAC